MRDQFTRRGSSRMLRLPTPLPPPEKKKITGYAAAHLPRPRENGLLLAEEARLGGDREHHAGLHVQVGAAVHNDRLSDGERAGNAVAPLRTHTERGGGGPSWLFTPLSPSDA